MIFNTLDMNLTRLLLWLLFKRIFAKKKICLKKKFVSFCIDTSHNETCFFSLFIYFVLFFFLLELNIVVAFVTLLFLFFLDTANSAASLSVQGLLSMYVNGGFCCCFF